MEMGYSTTHAPYRISRRKSGVFVVGKSEYGESHNLAEEPNLFVRFEELGDSDKDILDWVDTWGFLGLRHNAPAGADWEETEEPLILFKYFHDSFKQAFSAVDDHVKRIEPISDKWRDWITRQISQHAHMTQCVIPDRDKILDDPYAIVPHTRLQADTIAGTLVMQLYRFLLVGKKLKVCLLPGCNLLTTQEKYCSKEHRNLFHTWKSPKRRKIEQLDNGQWVKVEDKQGGKNGKG